LYINYLYIVFLIENDPASARTPTHDIYKG